MMRDERDQQHEADFEEQRNADDEGNEHHRPVHPLLAERAEQRFRDLIGAARLRHHLAEHRAQPEYDADEADDAAEPRLKRLRGSGAGPWLWRRRPRRPSAPVRYHRRKSVLLWWPGIITVCQRTKSRISQTAEGITLPPSIADRTGGHKRLLVVLDSAAGLAEVPVGVAQTAEGVALAAAIADRAAIASACARFTRPPEEAGTAFVPFCGTLEDILCVQEERQVGNGDRQAARHRPKGSIVLNDIDLAAVPPHRRSHHGIGFMPEDRRLVPDLSVAENVLLPAWAAKLTDADERLAWTYARMPELEQFAERKASLLSGGQQKLVALARSLMIGRRLLLLDEPFEGVAPALAQRLIEVIAGLKGEGATVLISESDYTHSRDLVDLVFVIERGVVTVQ